MAGKNNQKYALISVFDKTGIASLAKTIQNLGYKIISTGGTAKVIKENNIEVIPIEQITGNPESFDGRMKTISFQIESGILFDRSNSSHVKQAKELNIKPIDIVICNLYPFEQTIAKPGVTLNEAIENIDVGGPTMVRAAAKNFKNVLIVVDPKDYPMVAKYLVCHSEHFDYTQCKLREESQTKKRSFVKTQDDIRRMLAGKAFYHLSFYDSQVGKFFSNNRFPEEFTISARKIKDLRYGENPHQKASLYITPHSFSAFQNINKLWGRELSLVNVIDINAGIESVRLFKKPTAVVIKHANPCGIALGKNPAEALKRAIKADPESAFGGIIVLNKKMDLSTARIIGDFKDERKSNIDIVAVPSIKKDALEYLKSIRKSMGIYAFDKLRKQNRKLENIKFINGGFVSQTPDIGIEKSFREWKVVTKLKPTKKQIELAKIGWAFISRIKSNAVIILDKNLPMTKGIGSGQTSRIRATKIALEQAGTYAKGATLVSDSFFPFDDSIRLAGEAGIGLIIQQGGSVSDQKTIGTADKLKIPMVFTGRRAFWH
ncbi:MAG: bifunctional phosphoribosylaminoimidazolecarboxamide formyltransferase/IMP cyclohydrolase [bacterium]|nr:bifunctional phosphoribosylaminoimidazolecarboxamide formyltransferase/IMP cyclohydrolase [bacterium]